MSHRSALGQPRSRGARLQSRSTIGLLVLLVTLTVLAGLPASPFSPGPWHHGPVGTSPPRARTGAALVGILGDGGSLSTSVGGLLSYLNDTVAGAGGSGSERSYTISLTSTVASSLLAVELQTRPAADVAFPHQVPGGADNLPPFADWGWSILHNGQVDSQNWSLNRSTGLLARTVPWASTTFRVSGTSAPIVRVAVAPSSSAPGQGTRTGFVLDGPQYPGQIPPGDGDFAQLAKSLHPGVVRWGADVDIPSLWDATSGTPVFNLTDTAALAAYASSVGASPLLSIPAGSWGDGNALPAGMPLNTSFTVSVGSLSGHFAAPSAYRSYVTTLVADLAQQHLAVGYFNVGNEVPFDGNATWASTYAALFNIAAEAIHAQFPSALVGSDVMMNPAFLDYFATHTSGVGFLSFHFYPAYSVGSGSGFAPPTNLGGYWSDPTLMAASSSLTRAPFVAPRTAQSEWFNLTHRWVPVLGTESNLNSAYSRGTDPRQQGLFGAAWLASTLIDGATQNLSAFTYFTLVGPNSVPTTVTGPFGGWGYGLASEGTGDADLRYAPYWALSLWGTYVPAGAQPVEVASANPALVAAYAVRYGTNLSVVLVNRVDMPVTIPVSLNEANYTASSVSVLDAQSYQETLNLSTGTVQLGRSGVRYTPDPGNGVVTVDGYGVAVVSYQYAPAAPSTYPVWGTARDALTDLPVANASVTLGSASVVTASNGSFSLPMPNGTYGFSVDAAGYAPLNGSVTVLGAPVRLAPLLFPAEAGSPALSVTPSATVVAGAAPFPTALSAVATGGSPPYGFAWTLGDGSTATGPAVTHEFNAPGNFTAEVVVTDGAGHRASGRLALHVMGAALSVPTGGLDAGTSLEFTARALGGFLPPVTASWSSDDGAQGSGATFAHEFADAGPHAVDVVLEDANGIRVSAHANLTVAPKLVASLTARMIALPTVFAFDVGSLGGSGPYTVALLFGDGGRGSGASAVHGFPSPGTYLVHAWVNDSANVSDALLLRVVVPTSSAQASSTAPLGEAVAGWVTVVGLALSVVPTAVSSRRRRRSAARPNG